MFSDEVVAPPAAEPSSYEGCPRLDTVARLVLIDWLRPTHSGRRSALTSCLKAFNHRVGRERPPSLNGPVRLVRSRL